MKTICAAVQGLGTDARAETDACIQTEGFPEQNGWKTCKSARNLGYFFYTMTKTKI
jgi:hypothetical protein